MAKNKTISNQDLQKFSVDVSLSAKVVELLQDKKMSLSKIAKLMDLSKSFVSRVAKGERSLTIARLKKLEERLQLPLPLLLLEAVETKSMSKKLKEQYRALRNAVGKFTNLS